MAIKVSNQETINSVINFINDGIGETNIHKRLKVGRKPIRRIAIEHGLHEKLRLNNKSIKSILLKDQSKSRHLQQCQKLDELYGKDVCNIVNNGGILNDVTQYMANVSHKQVLRFLEYKNLNNIRKINSKKYVSVISKINGAKAKLTLTNKETKPITPEIIERFFILKETLKYKQKVYDALKREFGFGEKKRYQLCKKYGYPMDNPQTGELNSMYGKSPGNNAGIGVKCWLLYDGIKYFCRSSLELRVLCYFIDKRIEFQISKHRILYEDETGKKRTYCPDLVISKIYMLPHIYEIKPHMMTFIKRNQLKSIAAKKYCERFGMVYGGFLTEQQLELTKYDFQYILSLINMGVVIIDDKNVEKLKRNII